MKGLTLAGLLLVQLLIGCATVTDKAAAPGGTANAVTVTSLDNGSTRVVLATDAAFAFGSIVLQPVVSSTLLHHIGSLKQQTVVVSGYTDNVGAATFNQTLSRQRAQSVANALELDGFPAASITVHGYGETGAVTTNETETGRRMNRRVELLFSPRF